MTYINGLLTDIYNLAIWAVQAASNFFGISTYVLLYGGISSIVVSIFIVKAIVGRKATNLAPQQVMNEEEIEDDVTNSVYFLNKREDDVTNPAYSFLPYNIFHHDK